jgi:hypothetical protein
LQDIYRYLKESELKHMPKWNYMTKQTDINHNMRSVSIAKLSCGYVEIRLLMMICCGG